MMSANWFVVINNVLLVICLTQVFPYVALPLFLSTTFSGAPAGLAAVNKCFQFNNFVCRFSDFSPSLVTKKSHVATNRVICSPLATSGEMFWQHCACQCPTLHGHRVDPVLGTIVTLEILEYGLGTGVPFLNTSVYRG